MARCVALAKGNDDRVLTLNASYCSHNSIVIASVFTCMTSQNGNVITELVIG